MSRVRATVIVLAVLLAVYVGAYFAFLDTAPTATPYFGPQYKTDRQIVRIVFSPLAWLDYKLRPDYWNRRTAIMHF